MSQPEMDREKNSFALWCMTLGIGAILVFMAWKLLPLMADALQGTPSIEQLRQVDGNVAAWRRCRSAGRNKLVEEFTLESQGRTETVEMPCVMPKGEAPWPGPHHMTVLLKDDELVGPVVFDVRYDGRQLMSYSDVKKKREWGLPFLAGVCVLALAIVGALFAFLVRQCRLTVRG